MLLRAINGFQSTVRKQRQSGYGGLGIPSAAKRDGWELKWAPGHEALARHGATGLLGRTNKLLFDVLCRTWKLRLPTILPPPPRLNRRAC